MLRWVDDMFSTKRKVKGEVKSFLDILRRLKPIFKILEHCSWFALPDVFHGETTALETSSRFNKYISTRPTACRLVF